MKPSILDDAAMVEFDEAVEFYEDAREGLGYEFRDAVLDSIESICISPKRCPKYYREVRRLVMKRFPYLIYFIELDEYIRIVSVFHAKRNPRIWKRRVK
jgi:plasmid stabilization system protein ParE